MTYLMDIFSSFPFNCFLKGSLHRIPCNHLTLSSASSSLTQTNFMSSFSTCMNLLFGFLPGSLNLLLPIYSQSFLCACQNYLSLTLSPKHLTTLSLWSNKISSYPSTLILKQTLTFYILLPPTRSPVFVQYQPTNKNTLLNIVFCNFPVMFTDILLILLSHIIVPTCLNIFPLSHTLLMCWP